LSFAWKVQWSSSDALEQNGCITPKPIGIFLIAVKPVIPANNTESDIWDNLFVDFSVEVLLKNRQVLPLKGKRDILTFK